MTGDGELVDCPLCRADPRVDNCPLCWQGRVDPAIAALYRVDGLEACAHADIYLFLRMSRDLDTSDLPDHVHIYMAGVGKQRLPFAVTAAEVIEDRFHAFFHQDWVGARVSFDPLKNVVIVSPDATLNGAVLIAPRVVTKLTGSQRAHRRGNLTRRFPTGDPDHADARTLRGPSSQRAKHAQYRPKRPNTGRNTAK